VEVIMKKFILLTICCLLFTHDSLQANHIGNLAIVYDEEAKLEHRNYSIDGNHALALTLRNLFESHATPILVSGSIANTLGPILSTLASEVPKKIEQGTNDNQSECSKKIGQIWTKLNQHELTQKEALLELRALNEIYTQKQVGGIALLLNMEFNKNEWRVFVLNTPQKFTLFIPESYVEKLGDPLPTTTLFLYIAPLKLAQITSLQLDMRPLFTEIEVDEIAHITDKWKVYGKKYDAEAAAKENKEFEVFENRFDIATQIEQIFKTDDISFSWNIYTVGHGSPGRTYQKAAITEFLRSDSGKMAGMPAYDFFRLFDFASNRINTNTFSIETCFSGGYHATGLAQLLDLQRVLRAGHGEKTAIPEANFATISFAATERPLRAESDADFTAFFDKLTEIFNDLDNHHKTISDLTPEDRNNLKETLMETARYVTHSEPTILLPQPKDTAEFEIGGDPSKRLKYWVDNSNLVNTEDVLITSKDKIAPHTIEEILRESNIQDPKILELLFSHYKEISTETANMLLTNALNEKKLNLAYIIYENASDKLAREVKTRLFHDATLANDWRIIFKMLPEGELEDGPLNEEDLITVARTISGNYLGYMRSKTKNPRILNEIFSRAIAENDWHQIHTILDEAGEIIRSPQLTEALLQIVNSKNLETLTDILKKITDPEAINAALIRALELNEIRIIRSIFSKHGEIIRSPQLTEALLQIVNSKNLEALTDILKKIRDPEAINAALIRALEIRDYRMTAQLAIATTDQQTFEAALTKAFDENDWNAIPILLGRVDIKDQPMLNKIFLAATIHNETAATAQMLYRKMVRPEIVNEALVEALNSKPIPWATISYLATQGSATTDILKKVYSAAQNEGQETLADKISQTLHDRRK